MEINYNGDTLTFEEYVLFQKLARKSGNFWLFYIIIPILCFIITLVIYIIEEKLVFSVMAFSLLLDLLLFIILRTSKATYNLYLTSITSKTTISFTELSVKIEEHGNDVSGTTYYRYPFFKKIVLGRNMLLLYVTQVSAYVICLDRLGDQTNELIAFLEKTNVKMVKINM